MNDAFQDRERGFERKYELEQEQAFKIKAHRNRLFGLWVAAQLGKVGVAAEIYALELVAKNVEHSGDESMLSKVREDIRFQNIFIEDKVLLAQLHKAEMDSTRDVVGSDT